MKVLFFLALVFATTQAIQPEFEIQNEFMLFKKKFGKNYNTEEEDYRYHIFKRNAKYIEEINAKDLLFKLAIGPFADLTYSEFASNYLLPPSSHSQEFLSKILILRNNTIPAYKNWVEEGHISHVESQGNCKSAYAIAATGSIESARSIELYRKVIDLSVQETIDCNKLPDVNGCDGGIGYQVYNYYINQFCIFTEEHMPYKGEERKCNELFLEPYCTEGILVDWKAVQPYNEVQLALAVNLQPTDSSIYVNENMQHYSSGILTSEWCTVPDEVNQEILLVGFGNSEGTPYWIGQNSWGTDWGMNGYVLIQRDPNNVNGSGTCNIAYQSFYPITL